VQLLLLLLRLLILINTLLNLSCFGIDTLVLNVDLRSCRRASVIGQLTALVFAVEFHFVAAQIPIE